VRISDDSLKIQLFYFAGCPNAAPVRALVAKCLERLAIDTAIVEVVSDQPSPTLHINDKDVMGEPTTSACACRLDLPTEADVMRALIHAGRGPTR